MARAKARVDRDAVSLATTFEQDVIVRALDPCLRAPVDDSPAEDAVAPKCYAALPARTITGAQFKSACFILPYERGSLALWERSGFSGAAGVA